MANILQVTTPNLNTDNRHILSPQDPRNNANNPSIHNPVDPTRVVRADGRDGEQMGNAAQDPLFNIIDYDSNYGAFVRRMEEDGGMAALLERLLFTDAAALGETGKVEVGELVEKFLLSMSLDSPEELLEYLQGQGDMQARFSGMFFDKLRSLLSQNPSDALRDASLDFLKSYNDYASGGHLLQQMHTLTDDIEQLLLRAYRNEFREIADAMEWGAPNGDTAANTGVLNNRLIPFLSAYISRTHDYGAVREAAMHLVFHAVRYQNGNLEKLMKLFDSMMGDRAFVKAFKGEGQAAMENLLQTGSRENHPALGDFADGLAGLLLKGANGHAGLENVQQYYNIMDGLLLNESVYMPLLHFILPFQYEDNNVMSEMWVDPDARRGSEEEGRNIKVFLKFNIQNLGKFELTMTFHDHETKMQLFVPPALAQQDKKIQSEVADILKNNGIRFSQLMVRERVRDRRVDEVFPEIREKERTINVRI